MLYLVRAFVYENVARNTKTYLSGFLGKNLITGDRERRQRDNDSPASTPIIFEIFA